MTEGARRAIVAHPYWGRGGAEIAAVWMIQALQQAGFTVDIITRGGFDGSELNGIAGASVDLDRLTIKERWQTRLPFTGLVMHAFYLASLREAGRNYDLRVTASGAVDWGNAAIHFLSSITWNDRLLSRFAKQQTGPLSVARNLMGRVARSLVPSSGYSGTDDLFIANSRWTAEISAPECHGAMMVIPPPVVPGPVMPEAKQRTSDFVCLGRIEPEKQVERCIRILASVRESGHPVRLHLIGHIGSDTYGRHIQDECDRHADWVVPHGALYSDEKWQVMRQCAFGLSACAVEAFGMATAEMMSDGMIVFVPEAGAQKELVQTPKLHWETEADAVQKIIEVLQAPAERASLANQLRTRAESCGPEHFIEQVVRVTRAFVTGGRHHPAIATEDRLL